MDRLHIALDHLRPILEITDLLPKKHHARSRIAQQQSARNTFSASLKDPIRGPFRSLSWESCSVFTENVRLPFDLRPRRLRRGNQSVTRLLQRQAHAAAAARAREETDRDRERTATKQEPCLSDRGFDTHQLCSKGWGIRVLIGQQPRLCHRVQTRSVKIITNRWHCFNKLELALVQQLKREWKFSTLNVCIRSCH